MLFDLQEDLSEEADALVFKLLPLLKHLLHVLHVLRGQLVELLQRFLISFFSLQRWKTKQQREANSEPWLLCFCDPDLFL